MKLKAACILVAAIAAGGISGPALAETIAKEKLVAMAQYLPPPGDAKRDQGPPNVSANFSGITWMYRYDGGKMISVQLQAGKRFVDNFRTVAADKATAARYGYEVSKMKGRDVLFRAKPNKPGIDDDYTIILSETRQLIVKARGIDAAALRAFVEKIDFEGFAKAG